MNSQTKEIRINVNGTNHDIKIQNMDVNPAEEYNFTPRRSIGGKLRSQGAIRGVKFEITLDWDYSTEHDEIDALVEAIRLASIYDGVTELKLYPDTAATSDTSVADYTGGAGYGFDASADTIDIPSHGLDGKRVKYDNSNVTVTGLTNGDFYYIYATDADTFSFTDEINKTKVDITNVAGTGDFLYEVAYMDVIPINMKEMFKYENTIRRYRPSMKFESVYLYVSKPAPFKI